MFNNLYLTSNIKDFFFYRTKPENSEKINNLEETTQLRESQRNGEKQNNQEKTGENQTIKRELVHHKNQRNQRKLEKNGVPYKSTETGEN